MKKSLIFVGMLSIGFAYAQEGNVGINTDQPKATLDIQPNATNLAGTTNEGILAPRLSKTRIANIEASKLTEGTLVYATDDATSPISAYTGADTKVAKITEKGYYFYNGTEWVKAGVGANGELWATRPNDEDPSITETYLKPALTNGHDFFYSSQGGIRYRGRRADNTNTGSLHMDHEGIYIGRHNKDGYGPALLLGAGRGTYDAPEFNQVNDDLGRIVWSPTLNNGKTSGWASQIYTKITEIESPTSYASNIYLGARGLGKTNPHSYSFVINGKTDRVGIGVVDPEDKLHVNGAIRGSVLKAFSNSQIGPFVEITNESKVGDDQAYKWNIYNMTDIDGVDGGYKNALAFWSYNKNNVSSPSNRPQFIITDDGKVEIGGNAIYKDNPELKAKLNVAGTIMSSSLAQTGAGDRVVYADENGILKTDSVSSIPAVQVGSTNAMECNPENRGKMNFIQGEDGKSDVFGICMKNKNGNYYWGYMVGGNNPTNGTGAFGSGL